MTAAASRSEAWTERSAAVGTFVRRFRRLGIDSARWRFHAKPHVAPLTAEPTSRPPGGNAPRIDAPHIDHVAFYTRGNAGDTVLVSAVRAAFDRGPVGARWDNQHAHWRFSERALARANASDLVLIGGGGLFLADTNANAHSGWQWNADVQSVERLTTPVVVFAVGYNRFRGQAEFSPVFTEHLTALATKATYIGLRNSGSLDALRRYLPDELHPKLRYQPCPTTVLARLDPTLLQPVPGDIVVGVTLAFDRANLRFGDRADQILSDVGDALRAVEGAGGRIVFLAQCPEDVRAIDGLGALRTLTVEPLYGLAPRDVAAAFARTSVVLGMRGHSQMIPFGLRRPIVSLITHDKLRFFLDDIGRPEWGVEAGAPDLATRLFERLHASWTDGEAIAADIDALQDGLWRTTVANVDAALALDELERVA